MRVFKRDVTLVFGYCYSFLTIVMIIYCHVIIHNKYILCRDTCKKNTMKRQPCGNKNLSDILNLLTEMQECQQVMIETLLRQQEETNEKLKTVCEMFTQLSSQQRNHFPDLDREGWVHVRHVAAVSDGWHPANDQLRGTDEYRFDGAWSKNFEKEVSGYNEFLFAFGDRSKWLVATKESVTGDNYADTSRCIERSSLSPNSKHEARWYRRVPNKEDPWISVIDHGPAIKSGDIVYGENRFGRNHWARGPAIHGGADVYIRCVARDGYLSSQPIEAVAVPSSYDPPSKK
mmetsp:Transcript_29544/g.43581  ORF Transcript_29544/g.43581 Transcript_29544/m.43581 type:complete len:288 (-) Transcript_29544:88-951(-)